MVVDDGCDRECYLLVLWWLMMGLTGVVTCATVAVMNDRVSLMCSVAGIVVLWFVVKEGLWCVAAAVNGECFTGDNSLLPGHGPVLQAVHQQNKLPGKLPPPLDFTPVPNHLSPLQ